MHSFSPEDMTSKAWSKLIKGSIIPRPIAWITTQNKDNVINAAPFSYFNIFTPTILAVSIQYDPTQRKDTARNLIDRKEAVVHIPDKALLAQMDQTSAPLPSNESEIELAGLHIVASDLVQPPGIQEAKVRIETKLEAHIPLTVKDSDAIETELFLLRIVKAHLAADIYDVTTGYVDSEKLDPVARLGGPDYSIIDKIKDFKRNF